MSLNHPNTNRKISSIYDKEELIKLRARIYVLETRDTESTHIIDKLDLVIHSLREQLAEKNYEIHNLQTKKNTKRQVM